MLNAKKHIDGTVKVDLLTTQYEEDIEIIPQYFTVLSNLEQSVLDINPKLNNRKLPLIKDILLKAYENSDAEYFIYTNVDIGLMPFFYEFVDKKIKEGYDALVINRRRLSKKYSKVDDLTEIYADLGASHPGFDCFVFKRELIPQLILADICVGISFIGVALMHNVFCFAQNPLFLPDKHLTFHIGTDVLVPRKNIFYKHNKTEFFKKVYPQLKPHIHLEKFPYGNQKLHKRLLGWGLNPSLFTSTFLELEGKSFLQKIKVYLDEIRWRILQK
ncbi:MAG: hypothetical protein R2777_06970 [Chitinophagales bacterium]